MKDQNTRPPLKEILAKVLPQGKFWTKRWHLVSGCTKVSPGCARCWMEKEARLRQNHPVDSVRILHERLLTGSGQWNNTVRFNHHLLLTPLYTKKPEVFAIWTDLYHESVSDANIDRAMAVMLLCHVRGLPHLFIAPTKRAARQREYFASRSPAEHIRVWWQMAREIAPEAFAATQQKPDLCLSPETLIPLPNLLGCVTTESKPEADRRLPDFDATPFRHRILLAEPLLGPLDLERWLVRTRCDKCGYSSLREDDRLHCECGHMLKHFSPALDGIITGGESGHGARPSHPDWFRTLRDQCEAAGMPFMFKSWGEWAPYDGATPDVDDDPEISKFLTMEWEDGAWRDVGYPMWCDFQDSLDVEQCTARVGKKAAGRLLDGKEHLEVPDV